jgi:DNA-binding transcriptional MerR regulator
MADTAGHLRIGELGRRVGVSPELLRAWERRYGLMRPSRSAGGFRLYSEADEARVRQMKAHLEGGLSAAEAARATLERAPGPAGASSSGLEEAAGELRDALERFDEPAAHGVLDRALASFSTEAVLTDVVLPVLRALGERWETGAVTVAQEHFASHVLRGRLLGLARGWGRGLGPVAVLAGPPGELHDIPLIVFGISLRAAGWRIAFLGGDTPVATLEQTVATLEPAAVVLNAVTPAPLEAVERELARLARRTRLALGGAGADPGLAARVGAVHLSGDPVSAAGAFAAAA